MHLNAEHPEIWRVQTLDAERSLTLEGRMKTHDQTRQTARADLVWRAVAVNSGVPAVLLQQQAELQSGNP